MLRPRLLRVSSGFHAARGASVLRAATAADRGAVHALLTACELPVAGVDAAALQRFIVAERDGAVVGVAGLEIYGPDALLRSVAVDPAVRAAGLGGALTERLLGDAPAHGVRRVFLLTTTAESFFARHGFAPADRSQVGEDMLASVEFTEACPATAALMVREL